MPPTDPALACAIHEVAHAKINLALHVTGRREDGYHLLDSLVVFAAFGDVITLQPGALSLRMQGPFAQDLTADRDNLCLRAARLAGADVAITLHKNLPVASGIGGGSADAAAVLRGLARMGHGVPADVLALGADVPVCMDAPRPARMQGIGQMLTPLPPLPGLSMVLVNPGVAVPTPDIFRALTRRDNAPLPPMPDCADRGALLDWLSRTRNDLQPPAMAAAPVIATVLDALRDGGAAFARMSGSGATCFGIFDDAVQARTTAVALTAQGWWAVATELAQPQAFG